MDPAIVSLVCILFLFIFMMLGVPIVYSLGFYRRFYGPDLLRTPARCTKSACHPSAPCSTWDGRPCPFSYCLGPFLRNRAWVGTCSRPPPPGYPASGAGLVVAGIIGEAMLAATLGTSAASIIVVGNVAVPEFEKQGYDKGFSLGALLAGGVLGPLIPPSATMIIYAVLTNVSLGQLFIAGIIPGLILVLFLSVPAVLMCYINPRLAPLPHSVSWKERITSLKGIWAVALVMLCIIGAIYFGIATPTETAGVGSFFVLILGIVVFRLRWAGLRRALIEAATVNGLILFIIIGASFSLTLSAARMWPVTYRISSFQAIFLRGR